MAETLTSLQNAALHAIGRTPATTTTTTQIANDGASYFYNAHNWRWRDKALSLDAVSAQNYIALPTDFEQLISIRSGTNATKAVIQASLDEIITLRQLSSGVGGYYYVCPSWTPQTGVTAAPIGRLEIYPTPAASEVGTFSGRYRRKIPDLSSGTDAPDIPTWAHPALKQMVRAWAVFVEDQQQGSDWDLAQAMLEQCKRIDGTSQPMLGLPRFQVGSEPSDDFMDEQRFTPWHFIQA